MPSAQDAANKSIIRLAFRRVAAISCILLLSVFLVSLAAANVEAAAPEQMGPTQSFQMGPTSESWVILPSLPPDASQAEVGEQLYILVCRACHGDVGRGLTADWISQWAPRDQNCWQSKCHSPNHPPDGFEIPRYVPPVMGPDALRRFSSAAELFDYIRSTMPWQAPDTLLEQEYWQITAFLLQANQIPVPELLDGDSARQVMIRQETEATLANEPEQKQTSTVIAGTEPVGTSAPADAPVEHPPVSSFSSALPTVLGILVVVPFLIWAVLRRGKFPPH